MSRVVRKVPADWQHPKDARGHYLPLYDGASLVERFAAWVVGKAMWERGLAEDWGKPGQWKARDPAWGKHWEDWSGAAPKPAHFTPTWPAEVCTHLMMYEDVSEGTPISPAFATAEELATWLATNKASASGMFAASYDAWLATITRGWAPSMVLAGGVLRSGVEGLARPAPKQED